MKEAEENIRDFEGEIEDEQDDIDEENRKINDSKSIISKINKNIVWDSSSDGRALA